MTQTRVLTFMLQIFLLGEALAQDNSINNALRLQNFSCKTRIFKDCSYDECLGTIPGYSQAVLFLVPQIIDSYRIHFHGHKLNIFPEYDRDLVSMVDAFDIPSSICKKMLPSLERSQD